MESKPLIGLLTTYSAPFHAYEPASELGVELIVFTPYSINWQTRTVRGLIWDGRIWHHDSRPLPASVYNRIYGPTPPVVHRLEQVLGKGKVFNHVTRFDKLKFYETLSKTPLGEHLPKTQAYTPTDLAAFLTTHRAVILKPRHGQLGRDIYLIRQNNETYELYYSSKHPIIAYERLDELVQRMDGVVDKNFIMQAFIPAATTEGRIFDLRFLVQKNDTGQWQVTASLSRISLKYSYITNLLHRIDPVERTLLDLDIPLIPDLDFLSEICLTCARLLEEPLGSMGELSVDLMLDETGQPWIIEANGKPMKEMFAELGDEDLTAEVYMVPIKYAKSLAVQ